VKVKDMEKCIADGAEVAVGHTFKGEIPTKLQRAEIVAVRQPRRVYTGERADWSGHNSNTGVRVRYLDDDPGSEAVVAPNDVYAPWDEYLEIRERALNENDRKARELAEKKARAEAAVAILGGKVHSISRSFKTVDYAVTLTLDEATALVERLEEGHA
jgi:hypothetical protein